MRRMIVTLELTSAQAAWLRGAIRTFLEQGENMPAHYEWADRWLAQLSQPTKDICK